MQDVRLAFRRLLRKKTYSAVIVISLALGIGANAAIFSVVNNLLLRPLPIKDVDRVVFTFDMHTENDPFWVAPMDAVAFRNEGRFFADMGLGRVQFFHLLGRERPERVSGAVVSSDYLAALGIEPSFGRAFTPNDDRPEADPVAVISSSFWKTYFGSDAGILGRTLNLDNRIYSVVGVLPEGFDFPNDTKIWVPFATNIEALPLERQAIHDHFLVARLRPGISLEAANTEVRAIAGRLEEAYPRYRKGWTIKLVPLRQQLLGDINGRINQTLLLLMAIVAFLLLITCANVASLLLARSVERSHETAVQIALGARRRRLISQLLIESVLLSLIAGVVGLFLASALANSMMALGPIYFFTLKDVFQSVDVDWRVLTFTFIVSLLTGVIFALAPITRTSLSRSHVDQLKEGGQRSSEGPGGRRLFDALIVGEIAVATILLIGAGLLVRSFQEFSKTEIGFRPDHLLTTEMNLLESDYPQQSQKTRFVEQVLERVRNLPGVTSAGITTTIPLGLVSHFASYTVEGKPPLGTSETPLTAHRLVTPRYLETLGVSLVQGRLIEEQDRIDSPAVAVVTEELAKRCWPGEDPIGKRIGRGYPPSTEMSWYTVVGVVKDVKEDRSDFRADQATWYLPYSQIERTLPLGARQRDSSFPVSLVVRTGINPSSIVGSIREAIASVNRNQPLSEPITMEEHISDYMDPERFTAVLSAVFAGLGLFLAAAGIYGVTSYSVTQRTREFSVRMAFGARWADLIRLVLGRGVRLALLGLLIGSAGGFALSRILSSLLYQPSPTTLEVFIGPAVVLLGVVLVAIYLPMLRLTRLEPIEGLRYG